MTELKITRSYKTYEPISLLPADGWRAVYACENGHRYIHIKPLVAFALTKICYTNIYENGTGTTDEESHIVGYVAGEITIYPAEKTDDFMGYLAPDTTISNRMEQWAKEYVLANVNAQSSPQRE